MAEDLAMSCSNSVMLGSRRATKDSLSDEKHFMEEMEHILKLKCDVSIVSNYQQLFVLVDAILQAGLWTGRGPSTESRAPNQLFSGTPNFASDLILG